MADLLTDILNSQRQGNANQVDGVDSFLHGAEAPTKLAETREQNAILNSREASNNMIANGDLVGALRNAQASGDLTYQQNLMNHINQNRQQLGAIAQSQLALPQEQRDAALNAANATLGGTDIDTSSLRGANNGVLNTIANSVIAPEQQIKNNQTNRGMDIDQQNANTNVYNSQTSRMNAGTEQYNADTNRQRLGIDATHYQNADANDATRNNIEAFNATHKSLGSGDSIVTLEGIPTNQSSPTLADRNNNPGNLVYAGQPGATQTASGYASFANPQDGINANLNQINRDINVHGYNTIDSLVDHWASTSPESDRRAYKVALARGIGKGVGDTLTSNDIPNILPYMAKQEGYHGNLMVNAPSNPGTMTPDEVNRNNAVNPDNPIDMSSTPAAPVSTPSAQPTSTTLGLTTPTTRGQVGSIQSYYQPGVGNVITNVAPAPTRDTKQDDAQRRSAALWQGAQQADQIMSNAEKSGMTPDQHQVESRVGTTLRSLSDTGQALNRYNDAAQRLAMEYANMYFGQGVSTKQMDEAANSITIKPTDSKDQVNDKIVNRQNMLNFLQQATHPGESVTPNTLAPGYVNPVKGVPSPNEVNDIKKALNNKDINAINSFKQKFGNDQLQRAINSIN